MNAPDLTLLLRLCLLTLLVAYWFQIRAMASDRARARKVELSDGNGRTIQVAHIMRRLEGVRKDFGIHTSGVHVSGEMIEATRKIVSQRPFFKRRQAEGMAPHLYE